jgi:hypothetical protein
MWLQDDQNMFAADLAFEALSMNEAALHRNFDEARFRARMIGGKASAEGHFEVVELAARIVNALGEPGTMPRRGYGKPMLELANLIGALIDEHVACPCMERQPVRQ